MKRKGRGAYHRRNKRTYEKPPHRKELRLECNEDGIPIITKEFFIESFMQAIELLKEEEAKRRTLNNAESAARRAASPKILPQ